MYVKMLTIKNEGNSWSFSFVEFLISVFLLELNEQELLRIVMPRKTPNIKDWYIFSDTCRDALLNALPDVNQLHHHRQNVRVVILFFFFGLA